jgi:predicted metal-dependent HD superfamily phosphohydrolase
MNDEAAVVGVVRDYYEGWYDSDAARMERALHPALAKRGLDQILDPERPKITTAERMIELTASGEGESDGADRRLDISVDDLYRDIASVTVRAAVYHEYIQLVRTPQGWKIVNVLWQLRQD